MSVYIYIYAYINVCAYPPIYYIYRTYIKVTEQIKNLQSFAALESSQVYDNKRPKEDTRLRNLEEKTSIL